MQYRDEIEAERDRIANAWYDLQRDTPRAERGPEYTAKREALAAEWRRLGALAMSAPTRPKRRKTVDLQRELQRWFG